MKKVTTESFISKAQTIYGDMYGYEKVNYINAKEKVILICKEHGDFLISPNKYLSGGGCQICGKLSFKTKMTKGLDIFLEEIKDIHGDLYDYTKTHFEKRKDKITIICKEHGEFKQTVDNHLKGQGCPICANKIRGENRRKSMDEFFNDCSYIHSNLYDYSKTKYNGMNEIIEPICKIHGVFSVLAIKHYHRNQGCLECSLDNIKSKPVKDIEQYLKENNISYITEYRFEDCKNKLPLPFDFYIPSLNLLIEYDGIQHFKSIDFWGGEIGLQHQKNNDSIKNLYCINNDINLLRISYKESHIKKLDDYLENK